MIRILFVLLLIGGSASAQDFPQKIVGKQRFTDSVQLQRFKNNIAGDSVLSTDVNGKIKMKKVTGTGAAVDTIYRISGVDSIYYIIGGITYKFKDSTGGGGGSGWSLTGNAGTDTTVNFIGTTDSVDLVIKTKGIERARFNARGALGLGSGTDYGTSGYALITNGSSTVPTWHNIQDGWFNIVRDGGADTTGATDVSTIFVNAMAAGWRNFFVPKGSFLISNQIQMHDSVTIKGAGRFSTIFKLTTDIAAFKCAIPSGGNKCTFSDIGFYGTYATGGGTSQIGISIDTAQKILIKSISGTNIGGFVVNILRNGYNGPYIDIAGKSNEITDSYFEANYGGVNFGTRGEYNTISNSTFTQNLYAIYNVAGNSRINGNTCVNNTYGLYMASGSNNGHGVATGNTFNHNGGGGVGANIYLSNLSSGFSFVNNTWVQSRNANAGLIEIVSCANVYFYGGFTSNDTVRTTGCTNIAFDNVNPYVAAISPVWINVSGQAPTVSYIGRIQNTFSLRDVANTKQFDLTHTNGKVNFTGTSGIKFGFLNAAADSTVDITGSLKASAGVMFSGLPTGVGTKAVRINAAGQLSVADTTAGGSGVTILASIGSSANANGATISGTTLNLEPASASFGGVVTTGAQTFAGNKTFSGTTTLATPFTLGATSVTTTGAQLNYLNAATGTTGTTSSNVVYSASPTLSGTTNAAAITASGLITANGYIRIPDDAYPNKLIQFGSASGSAYITLESATKGFAFVNSSGGKSGFFTSAASDILTCNDNGLTGFSNSSPASTVDINGSFAMKYAATATSVTLGISNCVVNVTATGQTITLPTAVGITGRIYTIKLTASGTGTVATTSSQTIDGSTTYSLASQYKYVTVQSTGANWIVIANN